MKPKYWGVMVFLVAVVVAAIPASGDQAYVASADDDGNAQYMALGDNGLFSGPEDLLILKDSGIDGYGYSKGANGIGDFDGDGDLDYILALGSWYSIDSFVFVIPKSGPGNQFDLPVHVATFSEPYFPSALTVADFNGDKMLDFVVASYGSTNCWLFLNIGDGQPDDYRFEPVLLPNTASKTSFDMDAADVNNDGMADFIVGSIHPSLPLKVNLWLSNDTSGVPVPKFESHPLHIRGFGIAVADFISSNEEAGNADLAVSNTNSLDLYKGDGYGSFTYYESIPLVLSSSPLDNGDFDRDGQQDLIAGNFGGNRASVVILFGDGTGDFRYLDADIYTRDGLDQRLAVTGPPFVEKSPIVVDVSISPRKLNLKSEGKWITANIWVPDGYDVGTIDPDTMFLQSLEYEISIPAHRSKVDPEESKLQVKFDRQALIDQLGGASGPIDLTVIGEISSTAFSGSGTIIAFGDQEESSFQKQLGKKIMSWFLKGQSKQKDESKPKGKSKEK